MIPLWQRTDGGIRVVRLTTPAEREGLVRLFEEIADAEGWRPDGALRCWGGHSHYFALEVKARYVGGLQLVFPDAQGNLPCQALWPEVAVGSPDHSAHVAILALKKEFRGQGLLFWHLVVEMWRTCVGEGITTLFLEVTPRVLPLYQRLGWPLTLCGEQRLHWGEDCYLCTLNIAEVAEALLHRSETSTLYRAVIAQAFRVTMTAREGCHGWGEENLPLAC